MRICYGIYKASNKIEIQYIIATLSNHFSSLCNRDIGHNKSVCLIIVTEYIYFKRSVTSNFEM